MQYNGTVIPSILTTMDTRCALMRIYAAGNGDGNGTHLSVYLSLVEGSHNDELTWPLRGRKFEIKLLNQISDSEHHSMIVIYDDDTPDNYNSRVREGNRGIGWGWSRYISTEDLNKITPRYQFLKDDCLFFQVTKLSIT